MKKEEKGFYEMSFAEWEAKAACNWRAALVALFFVLLFAAPLFFWAWKHS